MRKREGERARDGGREEKQDKRGDRLYRTKLSKIGERERERKALKSSVVTVTPTYEDIINTIRIGGGKKKKEIEGRKRERIRKEEKKKKKKKEKKKATMTETRYKPRHTQTEVGSV